MDGVYVYICCCIVSVCLLQPLQYQSIPLLESRILLYFFYLHVACNLAISQFYLFATALSILPPPSIHPCMYVYGSNSSEMRSILTIQDWLGDRPIDHGHSKSQPYYEGVTIQSTAVTSEYIVPQDSFESSRCVLVLPRGPCHGNWLAVVVSGYLLRTPYISLPCLPKSRRHAMPPAGVSCCLCLSVSAAFKTYQPAKDSKWNTAHAH